MLCIPCESSVMCGRTYSRRRRARDVRRDAERAAKSQDGQPTAEGHNLAGVTDGGYELRSRGPASQGFEALDNLVSRSRRSSPTRAASSPTAAPPTPPSQSSTAAMAEPTLADLLAEMKNLRTEVTSLKSDMAAMKDKSASSSEPDSGRRPEGARDPDPLFKHKKWDFPRFDGTVDPMLFINKFEALDIQQLETM